MKCLCWCRSTELNQELLRSFFCSQLMVSLLLCLLDWCMAVPLSLLLEPITASMEDHTSHKAPILDYIYRVGICTSVTAYCRSEYGALFIYWFLLFSGTFITIAHRHNNFGIDTSTPILPHGLATSIRLTSTATQWPCLIKHYSGITV